MQNYEDDPLSQNNPQHVLRSPSEPMQNMKVDTLGYYNIVRKGGHEIKKIKELCTPKGNYNMI